MITALAGVLGLAIGSFLNVVVWRVPRGGSVVSPPSACPSCGRRIRPYDNVPVVSWLVLRGRCRDCGACISPRYPLVELGTGLAFAAVAWWYPEPSALPAFLYLAALSVCLTLIDVDHHRLPDRIVLPAYVVVPLLLVLATFGAPGAGPAWGRLAGAAISGMAMFVAYFVMRIAYPRGMGFGDVKLAGVLGLYLGWWGWGSLAVGFFAAFVLGGLYSVGLVLARRAGRKSKVPFGPWMLLGSWCGLLFGEVTWSAYLGLVGL